jgi:hypothetical protein
MPLKGLDVTVRMAHAEEATQNIIAFTSLYQHNWYAGTYSLCLRFNYDPVYGDDSVSLQLMIYTPMTENNNEEPIKMAQIVDFHWFESNRIQLTKSRGEWVLSLNGTQLFAGQKSSEGKTLNDYLSQISPYFADGAYLQMFGCGNVAKGLALDDGIVIESAKALEKTSAVSVTVDTDKCAEITSIVYKTGVEVNVDLSEIFQVSGGTAEYFATLGAIEEGVWKYTSSTEGTAIVTVTAAVNGTSKDVTLQFHFERGAETALGSTSETTSGKQAGSGCKSACEGSFAVIACLIGAAVVLQKWHKKENER